MIIVPGIENRLRIHQSDKYEHSAVMYCCYVFSLFYVLCNVNLPLMLCVKPGSHL